MKKSNVIILSIAILVTILAILTILIFVNYEDVVGISSKSYPAVTMDFLIEKSEYIVLAKVESDSQTKKITKEGIKANGETKRYKELVTDTTLKIKEVYKGDLENNIDIIYRGGYGVEGEIATLTSTDNPNFKMNDEMILFLKKDGESSTYRMIVGNQAKFVYNSETNLYENFIKLSFKNIEQEIKNFANKPDSEKQYYDLKFKERLMNNEQN